MTRHRRRRGGQLLAGAGRLRVADATFQEGKVLGFHLAPMKGKPSRTAATALVPLPRNGSSVTPPGGVSRVISHAITATGFVVGWLGTPSATPTLFALPTGFLQYVNPGSPSKSGSQLALVKNRDAPPLSL